MKTRNEFLDFLKALAIILVVIGHCIQISDNDFDLNIIFKVIYSFHMPLFMFLAGASAKLSGGGRNIQRKFITLVVPYLSWYFINVLLCSENLTWIIYFEALFWSVSKGLWFLWILFLNYLTLWVFATLVKKI